MVFLRLNRSGGKIINLQIANDIQITYDDTKGALVVAPQPFHKIEVDFCYDLCSNFYREKGAILPKMCQKSVMLMVKNPYIEFFSRFRL